MCINTLILYQKIYISLFLKTTDVLDQVTLGVYISDYCAREIDLL